jgi:hypothetical protein
MKRIILLGTVALVMALMMAVAGPASADQIVTGDDVNVHPHRHFLITPNEKAVSFGPNACGTTKPSNQEGFDQYHVNVHDPAITFMGDPVTDPARPGQFAFQQENNPVALEANRC